MKILVFICVLFLSFFSLTSFVSAEYQVSIKAKSRIDSLMTVVEKDWGTKSKIWQLDRYEKVINSFSNIKLQGKEQKEMIGYLLYLFNIKVNQLRKEVVKQEDLIGNVNRNLVQERLLQWHNDERRKLGLSEYKINDKLNFTSVVRADNLARNNKTSYTHTRNPGDGYYNYDKILSWFDNLGVSFDYNKTAFSESVAYQYYNCNKSDCTQEMITALKRGFDFWMREKSWNGPHYRAIKSNLFTDMGFGVAVSGKRYWVVTHYAVAVK